MKHLILSTIIVFSGLTFASAQKNEESQKSSNLKVKVKEDAQPDIYVDGKKFDFPMGILDQTKIASLEVIKGEQAIKEYNAPNGVLLVTTKENDVQKVKVIEAKSGKSDKSPLIIIDGKKNADKAVLESLSPDDIDNIVIVKDGEAIEKYNAPNGVIIVTTKGSKKVKTD